MVAPIKLQEVLFLDIETVPLFDCFDKLNDGEKRLFDNKTKYQRKSEETPRDFYIKAGIWAEFGKVICISCGVLFEDEDVLKLRLKSFYSDSEHQLLSDFKDLLDRSFHTSRHLLCAHNGKEFDFPFLARRMIIQGIKMPEILKMHDKKPWEIRHLDTLEFWKFGDYKHYTSLDLLAHVLQVESPKNDIAGNDVARVYYKDHDLLRIVNYCEKDLITVARVYLRLTDGRYLSHEHITGRIKDEVHKIP